MGATVELGYGDAKIVGLVEHCCYGAYHMSIAAVKMGLMLQAWLIIVIALLY